MSDADSYGPTWPASVLTTSSTTPTTTDGTRRYDLILDIGGNTRLSRLRRALATRGTLVIVGGAHGGN